MRNCRRLFIFVLSAFIGAAFSIAQENTKPHTVNHNVIIDTDSMYMPQLNSYRRIWVYLPSDYSKNTTEHYPVIYMHDGQNLFDNHTSFIGEWGVDECLDSLEMQKGIRLIVVGIDNGSATRIDEYSPYKSLKYGGGGGDKYVSFLTETLKPYIDKKYRTKPGREHTAIMGSSLGGLISFYTAYKCPETFGLAGNFSPAYWFCRDSLRNFVQNHKYKLPIRMITVVGAMEGDTEQDHKEVVDDVLMMKKWLLEAGFKDEQIPIFIKSDGKHSEWFWRREFPAAIFWLFN